jgi:hypothetical protein
MELGDLKDEGSKNQAKFKITHFSQIVLPITIYEEGRVKNKINIINKWIRPKTICLWLS